MVDQYERRAAVLEERWSRSFHFVSQSVADALVVADSDEVTGCLSGRLRSEVRVEDVAIRVVPGLEPPYGAEVRSDRVTYGCSSRSRRSTGLSSSTTRSARDRLPGGQRGGEVMGGGEAKARSEELARGLRKEFGLDQVEAEFVVLVGRNGGLCLAGQVAAWRRSRKLAASPMAVSRWIGGLHDKLGAGFATFPFGTRGQP